MPCLASPNLAKPYLAIPGHATPHATNISLNSQPCRKFSQTFQFRGHVVRFKVYSFAVSSKPSTEDRTMLVLTRAQEEEIVIRTPAGEVIVVRVLGVYEGREVRLGISAPREVSIHRREVDDAIGRQQKAATKPLE